MGRDELSKGFAENGDDWKPIHMAVDNENYQALDDTDRAVLEAFGKSQSGHWLYPWNRDAIYSFASRMRGNDGFIKFNPRIIINQIIRDPLLDAVGGNEAFLKSTKFPSYELVSADVRVKLERVSATPRYLCACLCGVGWFTNDSSN